MLLGLRVNGEVVIVTVHGKGSGAIIFWDIDAAGAYNLVATELASGLQDRRQVTLSP